MKTRTKLAAFIGLSALAAGQASANLVVNGGFESGVSGFSSAYGNVTGTANGLATGGESPGSGEGLYAVDGNANFYHSAFTTAAPHSGDKMMIVNGSTNPNENVWTGSLSSGLTAGQTYLFSAWVMNVYHDGQPTHDDAQLEFSIGGNSLGTISDSDVGIWHQFTATYTPAISGELPTSVDLKFNYYANDFAMDDISLTAVVPDTTTTVPEPTTMIAGALLLLPFGLGAVRTMRQKKIA